MRFDLSGYLYRISILLVISLAATACVPTSRAQGLDPMPNPMPAAGAEQSSVEHEPREEFRRTTLATPLPGTLTDKLAHARAALVAQAAPPPEEPGVWFDVSLQPQLVDLFNLRATPSDIARIEHVSMLNLLDEIDVGRKLIVFKSAVDVEAELPFLADSFDIIGYNLESGPANLPEEQANPVEAARQVRALADQYGLLVALGPSREFVLNYGAEMAPYVDIFVLQVQRVQDDHATVREFVVPVMETLLAANPELEISVQIRTEGDEQELVELVEALGPELAGVSILTSQDTLPFANSLYSALDDWRRRGEGVGETGGAPTTAPVSTPVSAPVSAPEGGGVQSTVPATEPATEPRRAATVAADGSTSRMPSADGAARWFLFGSGLIFGVLVSLLAGTWIAFVSARGRTR